jgi:hypothetical protein
MPEAWTVACFLFILISICIPLHVAMTKTRSSHHVRLGEAEGEGSERGRSDNGTNQMCAYLITDRLQPGLEISENAVGCHHHGVWDLRSETEGNA